MFYFDLFNRFFPFFFVLFCSLIISDVWVPLSPFWLPLFWLSFSLKHENSLGNKAESSLGGIRAAHCYWECQWNDDIVEGQIITFGAAEDLFVYWGWMRATGAEGCQARAEWWQTLVICLHSASLLWWQYVVMKVAAEGWTASSMVAVADSIFTTACLSCWWPLVSEQHQISNDRNSPQVFGSTGIVLMAPSPVSATSCISDKNCLYLF